MGEATLVLGGLGLCGLAIARAVHGSGAPVRIADRAAVAPDGLGLPYERLDVRDRAGLERALEGVRRVVVSAVEAPLDRSARALREVHVDALETVLRAALDGPVRRVLVVSTSLVYGGRGGRTADGGDESSPRRPAGLYGRVRLEAERRIERAIGDGVPAVALRPHIVLGDGPAGVLAPVFETLRRHGRLVVPPSFRGRHQIVSERDLGTAGRLALESDAVGFFDVGAPPEDTLAALLADLESGIGEPVELAAESPLRLRALALAERLTGRCHLGTRELHLLPAYARDCRRLRERLGWRPRDDDAATLARAYRHHLATSPAANGKRRTGLRMTSTGAGR